MYCENCGAELWKNAKFCVKCGTKVELIEQTPKELDTTKLEVTQIPQQPTQPPPSEPTARARESAGKASGLLKLMRKPYVLIAVGLLIVTACMLVYIFAIGGNFPAPFDESDTDTLDPIRFDFEAEDVAEDLKDLFESGQRDLVSEVGEGVFERYEISGHEGKVYVTGHYNIGGTSSPDSVSSTTSIQFTCEFVGYKQASYTCTFDGTMTYYYSYYSRTTIYSYSSSESISYSGSEVLVTSGSIKDTISFSFSGENEYSIGGWIEGSEGDRFYLDRVM